MKKVITAILLFYSTISASTLQSIYDNAKPAEGYNKLLILTKDSIYTGGFNQDVPLVCIHGNGAIIELNEDTINVKGPNKRIDIDHCIFIASQNTMNIIRCEIFVSSNIINNTFCNTTAGNGCTGLIFNNCPDSPVVIQNNIFTNFETGVLLSMSYRSDTLKIDISNNDMWGCNTTYMYWGGWTGSPEPFNPIPGDQELISDPQFVSAAGSNYALGGNSPCIDYGALSKFSYNGTAPDIGAIESSYSKNIGTKISGDITDDLTADKSPYIITGEITIPADKKIKIYPGVTLKINNSKSINVYGQLNCAGEENDSVHFRNNSIYDIHWGNVVFYPNSSDSSSISYSIIRDGSYTNNNYGVISCGSNYISINNNYFSNGSGAVYCGDSTHADINGNTFFEDAETSGIYDVICERNSEVSLSNNYFYGSGVMCNTAKLTAIRNKFFGQDYYVQQTYWLIELINNSSMYSESNMMQNNYGAVLISYSKIKSFNDLITNCGYAYNFGNSSGFICNNTTSYNTSGNGFGVTTNFNSTVDIINSILWIGGSSWASALWSDNTSIINAKYCLLSQQYPGENLIYSLPFFADPLNDIFQVTPGSPALDSGTPDTTGLNIPSTDIAGKPRIANNRIDIGCYEGYVIIEGVDKINSNLTEQFELKQNYPNPFNPATSISYQLSAFSHVTLKVFDILGREEATLVNENKPAGIYNVQLSADRYRLSSGVYFYSIYAKEINGNKGFHDVKKMILLK